MPANSWNASINALAEAGNYGVTSHGGPHPASDLDHQSHATSVNHEHSKADGRQFLRVGDDIEDTAVNTPYSAPYNQPGIVEVAKAFFLVLVLLEAYGSDDFEDFWSQVFCVGSVQNPFPGTTADKNAYLLKAWRGCALAQVYGRSWLAGIINSEDSGANQVTAASLQSFAQGANASGIGWTVHSTEIVSRPASDIATICTHVIAQIESEDSEDIQGYGSTFATAKSMVCRKLAACLIGGNRAERALEAAMAQLELLKALLAHVTLSAAYQALTKTKADAVAVQTAFTAEKTALVATQTHVQGHLTAAIGTHAAERLLVTDEIAAALAAKNAVIATKNTAISTANDHIDAQNNPTTTGPWGAAKTLANNALIAKKAAWAAGLKVLTDEKSRLEGLRAGLETARATAQTAAQVAYDAAVVTRNTAAATYKTNTVDPAKSAYDAAKLLSDAAGTSRAALDSAITDFGQKLAALVPETQAWTTMLESQMLLMQGGPPYVGTAPNPSAAKAAAALAVPVIRDVLEGLAAAATVYEGVLAGKVAMLANVDALATITAAALQTWNDAKDTHDDKKDEVTPLMTSTLATLNGLKITTASGPYVTQAQQDNETLIAEEQVSINTYTAPTSAQAEAAYVINEQTAKDLIYASISNFQGYIDAVAARDNLVTARDDYAAAQTQRQIDAAADLVTHDAHVATQVASQQAILDAATTAVTAKTAQMTAQAIIIANAQLAIDAHLGATDTSAINAMIANLTPTTSAGRDFVRGLMGLQNLNKTDAAALNQLATDTASMPSTFVTGSLDVPVLVNYSLAVSQHSSGASVW